MVVIHSQSSDVIFVGLLMLSLRRLDTTSALQWQSTGVRPCSAPASPHHGLHQELSTRGDAADDEGQPSGGQFIFVDSFSR